MVQFFSKRRLKIAEQIIIVMFFAILIPMTISGIIINNVNQQSTRAQLRSAAIMISKIVSQEIDIFEQSINNELHQIITTLDFYNNPEEEQKYLDEVIKQKEDAEASSFFISPTIVCTTQRVFSHLRQSLPCVSNLICATWIHQSVYAF